MPLSFAAVATALLSVSATGTAQQAAHPTFTCKGELVSRVVIDAERPPFSGAAGKWRAAARAVGLHHATTAPEVITAFLSLVPGRPCTEFRRAESERVLRAQPFLSDATVRLEADTGGTVAVMVHTTDEVPVLVSARFRGIMPETFSVGNENVAGQALRVEARVERGRAYRTAYGGRVERDVMFGHSFRVVLEADRYQMGQRVGAELEHPFFTDLQRLSWHTGFSRADNYLRLDRPSHEPLALQFNDRSWDASALLRLFGTQTVALLGGAVSGRQFDPAAAGIVVDDTGFRADTGVTLVGRYTPFHVARIGMLGGIRRVTFHKVNGFDALIGSQDVMSGAALGLFSGRGLAQFGETDTFLSGALYAGAASRNALLASLVQVEGRDAGGTWNSIVGSARTALYWGNAPGALLVVSDEISGGVRSRLPLQVTFGDRDGGLQGYYRSGLAGERRNVLRGEVRWSAAALTRHADLGVATFSELGTLWAGDAPYGMNVTRASVGISLLAAYPTRSKRLYRADLAIPLTRSGEGGGRVEVRFSSMDRTQGFWREPVDVSRARTGTEPSRLFAWPTQQ
ncbi:MAG: hypothetical protein ABJA80_17255 [bacterium]